MREEILLGLGLGFLCLLGARPTKWKLILQPQSPSRYQTLWSTITIKIKIAYSPIQNDQLLDHNENYHKKDYQDYDSQSSAAAPAEEAAKALRVKRCNFSLFITVSDHHNSQAGWSRNLFFFCLYFSLFLTVSRNVSLCFLLFQTTIILRQDGGEILNGCDPNTAIGGFLLFPLFRAICAERGFEDVGAYGK